MIKLDRELLCKVGLGALDAAAGNRVLKECYEALELRVGVRLAERMDDSQLAEFEAYIALTDDTGASVWLRETFPDYNIVVVEEWGMLKEQLWAEAPAILAIEACLGPCRESYAKSFEAIDNQVQQPDVRHWHSLGDYPKDPSNTDVNDSL